ncbi:MAG: twin-arginine translocase TatA/TatE family subunit [Thermomicrobiales bacterium]|mgnify:CR=1 FL=1
MPSLGWQELVIVLIIVVIIFGAGKLPEIGGALGKSIKEFKDNTEGEPTEKLAEGTKEEPLVAASTKVSEPVKQTERQMRADEV